MTVACRPRCSRRVGECTDYHFSREELTPKDLQRMERVIVQVGNLMLRAANPTGPALVVEEEVHRAAA